ncbi:hypothetical protein [Gilvimarinus xylanilyticus]|uniref:VOC domain-containing protein n=1 Tax=Gilvimarinus xylanilyticus TaxID=2944139 RepID=A0A9X2HXI8_9GAMM|nr:hypothetical protein [Gilvimarinus xylanilyticus]MCP8899479.1 hypothetical protein [Gilvimarinus xylanilyticus]
MDITHIKPFIPSKDYDASKSFYTDIGFRAEHVSDDLTLFQSGKCFFFLQRFYTPKLADNFMLQVCVTDIDAAFSLCKKSEYKTKITEIQQEHWGQVFYLWGPAGELLHITELKCQ